MFHDSPSLCEALPGLPGQPSKYTSRVSRLLRGRDIQSGLSPCETHQPRVEAIILRPLGLMGFGKSREERDFTSTHPTILILAPMRVAHTTESTDNHLLHA